MRPRSASEHYALAPRPRSQPAGRWLCAMLRADIQTGRLGPGARLPSSRRLATLARMSRGTAVAAIEQLLSEGYLHARSRSGVFVASEPPAAPPGRCRVVGSHAPKIADVNRLEPFVRLAPSARRAFVTNVPAVDSFPLTVWARLASRRVRGSSVRDLTSCGVLGYEPLREVVADYLRRSRGVVCTTEQVVIVSGVQEAVATATRLLVGPGDRAIMETPGYTGALRAFTAAGARVQFVPVDADGMCVPARTHAVRVAYVTPAHQFPLGISMSYARRLALLEWAQATGGVILEDDYDSEFRYTGQPLPALQGLDTHGCVVFMGSFNKLLFPALRLGYLVVPPALIDPLAACLSVAGLHRPFVDQATLCDFIADGHFFRHLRRMRRVYGARRAVLADAAGQRLEGALTLARSEAGLQVFGRLLGSHSSSVVAAAAEGDAVSVTPLSRYVHAPSSLDGLVLGFAAIDEREIRAGIARLARTFDRLGTTPA
jgi:GntR family transcriptional regulator/MocR family aminotransferase